MMKHITCATALIALLFAPTLSAQTATRPQGQPGRAQQAMRVRIRDGVRSGQLTTAEVQVIRQRLTNFRAHAQELRRAGTLTPQDRSTLRRQWRQLSRTVFGLRHNRVRRGNQ